jgi:uncharacterized protein (TIGR02594 family)
MAKISGGSLIRRAGGPNILGTAGCLVQWPGKTDQLLLLSAARVLVGRTAEQFEAIEAVEAVDQPGKPIGCLYAWSDLQGPTTADVALVHVDPALVDPGIGPSGAPKGTNLKPEIGDKLTIFANGQAHNLTITSFSDQTTIDRVTPDSRAPVNYLNQIICDPATEDRCVGAMAMDGSNNIVGMVVGGDGTSFTLVTPIDALLSCTFGGPPGPALEVCTSVPGTAKPPEKVTHPDHFTPAVQVPGAAGAEPAWVTAGLKDLGIEEKKDDQGHENLGIEAFIAQAHCGKLGDAWCAIWANAKLEQCGIMGTRNPSSQSFCNNPNFVKLDGPALGAIAVYWRESRTSGKGHVGFYMGETATHILTLGGNESDAVRKEFEDKAKWLGYWWPKSVPSPQVGVIEVTSTDGTPTGKVT